MVNLYMGDVKILFNVSIEEANAAFIELRKVGIITTISTT